MKENPHELIYIFQEYCHIALKENPETIVSLPFISLIQKYLSSFSTCWSLLGTCAWILATARWTKHFVLEVWRYEEGITMITNQINSPNF